MDTEEQIKAYICGLPEPKRTELENLHHRILEILPNCKLSFLSGKDEKDQTVSYPVIGYGMQRQKTRDRIKYFYQIGLSGYRTGFSVNIMLLNDENYVDETYGKSIGKATVSGNRIKFRSPEDINMEILEKAILEGFEKTKQNLPFN